MIKKKLKLLDDILSKIEKSPTHSLSEDAIYATCMSLINKSKFPNSKLLSYSDPQRELRKILEFLEDKNLIIGKNSKSYYEITYHGILKLSKGGFEQEFQSQQWKNRLNSFFWLFVPSIAVLTFVLTLLQIFDYI